MKKISYCIPTKNNLRYLKNSINSIKTNSSIDFDIIVFVDLDNDGTIEWLNSNKIKYIENKTLEPRGIAYGYNRCIEMAETPIVCMFHADMYMAKGFDTGILKYLKPKMVVSGTRIEPPLHPEGNEKLVKDFGLYPEDFKKSEFDHFVNSCLIKNKEKTTRGIFAPWAIYKDDIVSIGMHDESLHSYHEDSDIFNRFILNGYDILQSWESYVYHLTCRGGQFQDGVESVTKDPKFHSMKNSSLKKYIRKWGSMIKNDSYQYPILQPKYNIKFNITNGNRYILQLLEPWCTSLEIDIDQSHINEYIKDELLNINKINSNSIGDIVVDINGDSFTENDCMNIINLSEIINDSGDIGRFELGNLLINIHKIEDISHNLIKL